MKTVISIFLASTALVASAEPETPDMMARFKAEIEPIMIDYCYDCHGDGLSEGGVTLDGYTGLQSMQEDRPFWKSVRHHIDQRIMPPRDELQPTDDERNALTRWIDDAIFPVDPNNPNPGRITVRRLNINEYQYTISDLLGVTINATDVLPPDDSGYGFDSIGDVLSLSPSHLEKFYDLASDALKKAYGEDDETSLTHRALFPDRLPDESDDAYTKRVLKRFARRAFRRPVTDSEIQRYVDLAISARLNSPSLPASMRSSLEAILVSPHFLFRELALLGTPSEGALVAIPEVTLASRLSYFLWSSQPDDELLGLAEAGDLRANLDAQIDRMLADDRAINRLTESFFHQWLQTRNLRIAFPDKKKFRTFHTKVGRRFDQETTLFFNHLISEDRPLTDLVDAEYTFADDRLAGFYGIPLPGTGKTFVKTELPESSNRRGILTHGSVLTITSNPNRTSPVKRGMWILENILHTPPPPAPANVPSLDAKKAHSSATLREQLELHRENPACASCHEIMDGIGFAYENFDAVGEWRDIDKKSLIDARGTLASGESFDGALELSRILMEEKLQVFTHCVAVKMLTFALGRGTDYYDAPALDQIVEEASENGLTVSAFIRATVHSIPFQYSLGPIPE